MRPSQLIDHPSGYLALSPRNRRFTVDGLPGLIAYRAQGRHLIALGGVHAPADARAALLDRFLTLARRSRRRVIAVQVRPEQAALFRERGFTVNQFGSSYAVRLADYSLAGSRRMKLRQKIRRAQRLGLEVLEVGRQLPANQQTFTRLNDISRLWLAGKGGRELDFMIGELGQPGDQARRIFVVREQAGRWVGFISYVPVWGRRPGWLHDLTRRLPDAPPGAMELCNHCLIEQAIVEGAQYLHFGFTPWIIDTPEPPGASRCLAWALRQLRLHGRAIYPAVDQQRYKTKWAPDIVEPELIAFRPLSPGAIFDLLRLTRAI